MKSSMAAAVLAGGPVPSRGVGSLRVNGVDVWIGADHGAGDDIDGDGIQDTFGAACARQRRREDGFLVLRATAHEAGSAEAAVSGLQWLRVFAAVVADGQITLAPDAADGAQTALARSILHDLLVALRAPRSAALHELLLAHGALAAVHDLLRAPEQAGTPLAALAADDHPVAEVCALALALLARLLAAAPAAAAAAAAGGGAALSSSLLQKLVSLVGMGIGAERALESVVDAAPPLHIARQLADALLRRMDQKGRDAPTFLLLARLCRRRVDGAVAAAADGHSDGGGGAAAADEWAASAAEGSVGGGWGVHADGQRAILLELLSQPRRAERLLVALTPDAAAALPPVGRLALGVDAARVADGRCDSRAARLAWRGPPFAEDLFFGAVEPTLFQLAEALREAAAPAAAQITEAEAAVREARGGFAAAFSAQLQLFASVCAGRHLEGIAIVQSEWLPFELAAGCARDASLPTRCAPPSRAASPPSTWVARRAPPPTVCLAPSSSLLTSGLSPSVAIRTTAAATASSIACTLTTRMLPARPPPRPSPPRRRAAAASTWRRSIASARQLLRPSMMELKV